MGAWAGNMGMAVAVSHEAQQPAQAVREATCRRCLATGAVLPKAHLVRFVVAPDGTVTPDVAGRLPGRGFWVAADRRALGRAVAKGMFQRAAHRAGIAGPIRVSERLADEVAAVLRRRCCETLGLARRSGQAVAGHDKVKGWLKSGRAGLLVQAADGADAGRTRLERLAHGVGAAVVGELWAAEIGQAFGREMVVHAALERGGLSDRLQVDAARLRGLHDQQTSPNGGKVDETTTGADDAAAAGGH